MNKKILAVALAILFIATAFTACKTKLDMTEIGGREYPLATDSKGNTIANEENQVAVIVTDREGEVITYADGEDQTYWLDLPSNIVEGEDYTFTMGEGWEYNSVFSGYTKEGKKDISFTIAEFENPFGDLENYMKETENASQEYIEELSEAFPNMTYEITDGTATSRGIPCKIVESKIIDNDGKMFHYSYLVNFIYNDRVINIGYECADYSYEEADVMAMINEAFAFGEKK